MGVIQKIVLSLPLVATLAHGQLSVDLNGGDITAPLKHQGKIEQQHNPGNIDTGSVMANWVFLNQF